MPLFRAIPSRSFRPNQLQVRRPEVRWPSNVPYVIDNIWEYLRPDNMPSRRHAVYCSPTPSLALANASGKLADDDRYVPFEVVTTGCGSPTRMAQLLVDDARRHPDRSQLTNLLERALSASGRENGLAHRSRLAPLFLPVLSKIDVERFAAQEPLVSAFLAEARMTSTFWLTALTAPREDCDGELFFELREGESYTLRPLELDAP